MENLIKGQSILYPVMEQENAALCSGRASPAGACHSRVEGSSDGTVKDEPSVIAQRVVLRFLSTSLQDSNFAPYIRD
jgi:hypothetical protein